MQIANPDLIVQKKTLKKRMNRNTKASLDEILKNDDLTSARVGVALPLRFPPAAELCAVQKPHIDEVTERFCGAARLLPLLGHQLGPLPGVALRH